MVGRDVARHLWISEIIDSPFIELENEPSGLQKSNDIIKRVRILGTIVSTDELVVDDSTGSIAVKNFEHNFPVQIGDPVLVIGRPRKHQDQPYILGEIVKKTDPKWFQLAKKQKPTLEKQDPLEVIRKLDTGEGANYEDVVSKLGEKGEDIITNLLAKGELFETRPGKLKVLE